ncbi:MAG TPA: DoxX family protein [Sphingobacteriaceae bacterium]
MKKIINAGDAPETINVALLVARVGIAVLMLTHGIPKLLMLFSTEPVQFPAVLGMSAEFSLGLTVFAEVVCSVFLLLGFVTRLAVIPLAITMLVAALLIHASDPFAVKELAMNYFLAYVVLFFAGSGKYSIDYLVQKKSMATAYAGRGVENPLSRVPQ